MALCISKLLNKEFGLFPLGLVDLKQTSFKPNHIIIGNRPLVFQAHNIFQIDRVQRDMGVFRFCRRTRKLPIHFGQVGFLQKSISLGNGGNPGKAQFLHQPILVYSVIPFNPVFRLRAVGRYYRFF